MLNLSRTPERKKKQKKIILKLTFFWNSAVTLQGLINSPPPQIGGWVGWGAPKKVKNEIEGVHPKIINYV